MKASSILDDYISSFESSFMKSSKKSKAHKENLQPFQSSSQKTREKSFDRYLSSSNVPSQVGYGASVNVSQIAPSKFNELCYDSDDKLISSLLNGHRDTRLTLDDIPTRENERQVSGPKVLQERGLFGFENNTLTLERSHNSSNLINFKDFYEQSKLEIKPTKSKGYESKHQINSKIKDSSLLGQRSKSTGLERDRFQNKFQSKLKVELQPIVPKYDINEFLPKESQSVSSRLSSSILGGQSFLSNNLQSKNEIASRGRSSHQNSTQQAAMELFSSNLLPTQKPTQLIVPRLNERAFSQHQNLRLSQLDQSPKFEKPGKNFLNQQAQPFLPSHTQSSVCSCAQLPLAISGGPPSQFLSQQMLLTQRSSCSCQFSNSSGGHSQMASPLSTNQKLHNPGHIHRPSMQGMPIHPHNIFQYAPQQTATVTNFQNPQPIQNSNGRHINHSYQSSIANVNLNSQFNNATSQPNLLPLGTPIPSQSNQSQRATLEPFSEVSSHQRGNQHNPFTTNRGDLNLLSSNEASPLQPQPRLIQNQQPLPQRIHTLDPNQQSQSNFEQQQQVPSSASSFMYKDRSTTFMRGTDQKSSTTGYNTDDLLRDSESEVDLNQVSKIIQLVNDKFMNGFQNYLKISSDLIQPHQVLPNKQPSQISQQVQVRNNSDQVQKALDRAQKELLAMQILSQNQNQQQIQAP